MSPTIYKINEPKFREKMAAFDYDWTLVSPKNGKTFPKDVDDWIWLYPNVIDKIKEYYNNDFMIVIFTNQSKQWKHEQILLVAQQINIPMYICIATEKEEYKPNTLMFNKLVKNKKINIDESFFVGDALGRKTDFSDSDKVFSENIGIKYMAPEVFFHTQIIFKLPEIPVVTKPELVIMVGYPASGKSTISNEIFKKRNYEIVDGDTYKTVPKILKSTSEHIKNNKSVVIDATNSSIEKRSKYIELAKLNNYSIRCIHMTTSLEESYKRNKTRLEDNQIPKIAYSVYTKYYDEPTEKEGFILIKI
jgi:bifunctional polynucleotide phosphatase/kinase